MAYYKFLLALTFIERFNKQVDIFFEADFLLKLFCFFS